MPAATRPSDSTATRTGPRYALLGAGGAIARWHVDAIEATGGRVVAAIDPVALAEDRATMLSNARTFADVESFAQFAETHRGSDEAIDTVVVCTPNDLHFEQCALALRCGADAICEKPVALDPDQVDELACLERTTGRRVLPVLQLREHPALRALRRRILATTARSRVEVDYRLDGRRLRDRWRADDHRSGGLVFELGVHTLDLCVWLFGEPRACSIERSEPSVVEARLDLARADVRWRLAVEGGASPPRRDLVVDGARLDLSRGCDGLHRRAYVALLGGRGPDLWDARSSIALAARLRRPAPPLAARNRGLPNARIP